MWGQDWGTMVWGGAALVPIMSPGGWLALGLALAAVGTALLRSRRVGGATIVGLALLALPLAGMSLLAQP